MIEKKLKIRILTAAGRKRSGRSTINRKINDLITFKPRRLSMQTFLAFVNRKLAFESKLSRERERTWIFS